MLVDLGFPVIGKFCQLSGSKFNHKFAVYWMDS